tara:strand:+ start:3163 stop:3345 length:183 start_codon:yes stop_codon:yes gene_type:complete
MTFRIISDETGEPIYEFANISELIDYIDKNREEYKVKEISCRPHDPENPPDTWGSSRKVK